MSVERDSIETSTACGATAASSARGVRPHDRGPQIIRAFVCGRPGGFDDTLPEVVDHADRATVAERRDQAGRLARDLARIEEGDYGRRSFATDGGEWPVKYEAGDVDFLRFQPRGGGETYVVSTKRQPVADALANALADSDVFVTAYNECVSSLYGLLDGVGESLPAVEPTDGVAAERDRIAERIRACCDLMAGELRRAEGGDYGTFAVRVDATQWELKWAATAPPTFALAAPTASTCSRSTGRRWRSTSASMPRGSTVSSPPTTSTSTTWSRTSSGSKAAADVGGGAVSFL